MTDSALTMETITLAQASELIRKKAVSPVELTEACLKRIDLLDERVKAWVTVVAEQAMAAAGQMEQKLSRGEYLGPLHGIPYGAKDLFYTTGIRTAAGSNVRPDFVPQENATVINKLTAAGAVLLGKTTTTEYAFRGGAPATRNPWNLAHTPGGSSSGSAAATAAAMALFALGTQTLGSLLRPAAYNGLTCLKATYGRVSRHGVIPASWSLDHVGALTRTVEDTALVLEAMAGCDVQDPTSLSDSVPHYAAGLQQNIKGKVIGLPTSYFQGEEPAITRAMAAAIRVLQDLGVRVKPIDLPACLPESLAAHVLVMQAEAAAYHQDRFEAEPEKFGPYIREQLAIGCLTPAVDYLRAQRIRSTFKAEFMKLFDAVDAIITPTTSTVAPIGLNTGDPAFNGPFTNIGLPSMTVPIGIETTKNLPIGMQLAAPPLAEALLLALGHQYQQATDWHKRRPDLSAGAV